MGLKLLALGNALGVVAVETYALKGRVFKIVKISETVFEMYLVLKIY